MFDLGSMDVRENFQFYQRMEECYSWLQNRLLDYYEFQMIFDVLGHDQCISRAGKERTKVVEIPSASEKYCISFCSWHGTFLNFHLGVLYLCYVVKVINEHDVSLLEHEQLNRSWRKD